MISLSGNGHSKTLHLEVTSDPANLVTVRKAVESLGRSCGFDEASWCELGLVVNEAMANVIRHAYHGRTDQPIRVDARFSGDVLHVEVRDWGNGVNPMELPEKQFDPLTPGGLGLVCLRQLMDHVDFSRQPDGMLLRMSRRLSHPAGDCARNVG